MKTIKKGYISYFPYINNYKGTCQFCEKAVEAKTAFNTKNFDGEWNTTCGKCYSEIQGVRPIIRTTEFSTELKTGESVSGSGQHTLFKCADCLHTVAYVKSKKTGKYYLANTYDKGYDSSYGIKRVYNFSPHFKDCADYKEYRLISSQREERQKDFSTVVEEMFSTSGITAIKPFSYGFSITGAGSKVASQLFAKRNIAIWQYRGLSSTIGNPKNEIYMQRVAKIRAELKAELAKHDKEVATN